MKELIEKQAAIDAVMQYCPDDDGSCSKADRDIRELLDDIENLPSAQLERKTGWWLIREGISDAQCSECKMYFKDVYDIDNSDTFCRHCGAKMEGLKVVKHG